MSNTSLSDTYSNLCRDYSSFIKWAINKISKSTDKWTDYTVSEPDTLLLSSFATMHDYVQYILDQTYLNTDIDKCSIEFLHQISNTMGKSLQNTNEVKIPIYLKNKSSKMVEIPEYSIFTYNNELFTNPDRIFIPANFSTTSFIVRNTMNEMIYKINKESNGEFRLEGDIEISSISVYGIDTDGNTIPLINCNDTFELLFDSNLNRYQVFSIDSKVFKIKISPTALNNYSAILVRYTIVDDYPIRSDLKLNLIGDEHIDIKTTDNVQINSQIPLNSQKITYLDSLTKINTLCNQSKNFDLGELSKRINNYRFIYETNSTAIVPLFEYTTIDNKALNGDVSIDYSSANYFKSLSLKNNILQIEFADTIPIYNITINYNTNINIVIVNNLLLENLNKNVNGFYTFSIELPDYDGSSEILIGFENLDTFIRYSLKNGTKIEQSEMSILQSKFYQNKLILHEPMRIRYLKPYILPLDSEIVLNCDTSAIEIMTKIINLLDNTLINNEIVNNINGSYRRLELLIRDNIQEIDNITFKIQSLINNEQRYQVKSDEHLVLDSVENYLNGTDSDGNLKINFKTKGDDQI